MSSRLPHIVGSAVFYNNDFMGLFAPEKEDEEDD
jgi:hypothetical protein